MRVRVSLDDKAIMPKRAHKEDAGFDLHSPVNVTIPAGQSATIDTGVHVEIPVGFVGFLKSKSGLNCKHGIQSEGVIDSGYTGSIVVKLYNHSYHDYTVCSGDKITQLVFLPIPEIELEYADSIEGGDRGNDGFGSTGR